MTAIKEGGRVRATIEGTARIVNDYDDRGYVSIEFEDVDGDMQRASCVPLELVTALTAAGDTGTPAELIASGLAKGSVINDNDHEDDDSTLYRWAYVGDDNWIDLQGDYDVRDSSDLEGNYGDSDDEHSYGVFTVEYSA